MTEETFGRRDREKEKVKNARLHQIEMEGESPRNCKVKREMGTRESSSLKKRRF